MLRESSTRHAHPRWSIVAVPAGAPRARLQNDTVVRASMRNCKPLEGLMFGAELSASGGVLLELVGA